MRTLGWSFRRQPRNPRVLLVPDQWSGSVQEYYHFVLGYFATIVLWTHDHPGVPVSVRDCGPMNPWLDLLPGSPDVEILTPGDMLHLFAAGTRRSVVLRGMDDPTAFDTARLQRFRDLVLTANGVMHRTASPRVTVIDRLSSGAFNDSPEAEVPASGRAVRSTPNLSAAAPALLDGRAGLDWGVVDAANLAPIEQVRLFSRTTVLVGQHGAGLANMVWMRAGGTVIEIEPPRPDYEPPFFRNLARACGHRHIRIRQENDHAPVPETELAAALATVLDAAPPAQGANP